LICLIFTINSKIDKIELKRFRKAKLICSQNLRAYTGMAKEEGEGEGEEEGILTVEISGIEVVLCWSKQPLMLKQKIILKRKSLQG
jgi:hypothetical protein